MASFFHLSLPCSDIDKTKKFLTKDLGLKCGRATSKWFDIDLFNNQLTYVFVDKFNFDYTNYVFESDVLPTFHFGIVLERHDWDKMYDKVNNISTIKVNIKTFLRDKMGEHKSFFIKDPNGYTIEFKMFKNKNEIFM